MTVALLATAALATIYWATRWESMLSRDGKCRQGESRKFSIYFGQERDICPEMEQTGALLHQLKLVSLFIF